MLNKIVERKTGVHKPLFIGKNRKQAAIFPHCEHHPLRFRTNHCQQSFPKENVQKQKGQSFLWNLIQVKQDQKKEDSNFSSLSNIYFNKVCFFILL